MTTPSPWSRSAMRGARRAASVDSSAVRAVAWLRVLVATGIAAYGSYQPGTAVDRRMFLLVGLVYLPWATMVLLAADSPGRLAVMGGPLADVTLIVVSFLSLPGAGSTVALLYAVIVAFAAYTWIELRVWVIGVASLTVGLAAQLVVTPARRLDGQTLWLLAAVTTALLLLVERVTGQQRSAAARTAAVEGRSDTILAKVADAVVVTDARGAVRQWNASAERLLGASSRPAVGRHCTDVFGLQLGERALDCSQGCALLRLPLTDAGGIEVWRRTYDGERQPLLANAAEVGTDTEQAEVVHSLRDITRLKQADEAKNLFLATASHELKTPLTVIYGFSQTLLAVPDITEEDRETALAAINRRAAELVRIVDRLLLSSRIEAGRIDVSLAEVPLVEMLADRAHGVASAIGRDVIMQIEDDLPAVYADPHGVVTVIDHLLDNAAKYSPAGGPITLAAQADGAVVRLLVSDTGIGMDAEQAETCFEKIWQAESTETRRFGGTGIGLYIVKSLVDAMGGRVEVDSRPGEGSTFVVTLRRAGVSEVSDEVPDQDDRGRGERSIVHEFMRQLGIPGRRS